MASMAGSDDRGAFIIRYFTPPAGDDRLEHREQLVRQRPPTGGRASRGPTTIAWLREQLADRAQAVHDQRRPGRDEVHDGVGEAQLGATSTAPLMVTISTAMPRSANACRVLLGWLVARRSPRRSSSERAGLSLGTAASRRQRP